MKFIQLEQKLQLFTNIGKYNETSYWGTDITNDGVNIIITNLYDPNFQDVTVAYVDITEPVTATIDELTDILRCWVLTGIDAIKVLNDTPWLLDADCDALQNVGGDLYFKGLLVSGGGGGNVVTADNGLNFTGGNPNNITLGGALLQDTTVDTNGFLFQFSDGNLAQAGLSIDNVNAVVSAYASNGVNGAIVLASDTIDLHTFGTVGNNIHLYTPLSELTIQDSSNILRNRLQNQFFVQDGINLSTVINQDLNQIELSAADSTVAPTVSSILTLHNDYIFLTHSNNTLQSQIIMDDTRSQFSFSDGTDTATIVSQTNGIALQTNNGNLSTISIDNNLGSEAITISSNIADLYINTAQTSGQLPYSVLTLVNPATGLMDYSPGYQKVVYTLSPATLFTLSTAPFDLLTPPNSGYYYDIDKILLEYTYSVSPYTLANPLEIRIGGSATKSFRLINNSQNAVLVLEDIYNVNSTGDYQGALLTDAITLSSATDPTGVGSNGTLRVVIWYREVGFGF